MFYELQHSLTPEYFRKEYNQNFSFPAHLHKAFEYFSVTSGEMIITVDNTPYHLYKGDSLLVFPNQIHSISSTESSHNLCIFSPELVRAYTSKITGMIPESNKFTAGKHIAYALSGLSDNASVIDKKALFYSICAEFDKTAKYVKRDADKRDLLSIIFKYVEANYNKACSLYNLSDDTGYSYSYLSRYFKNIVGVSFNNYVNRYRISNACYLLGNTDYTILQCALDSGYDSLRSFNRNFTDYLSVTPSEYRASLKNNE